MLSPARRLCYQFFQSNPDPNLVFRHWPVTVLRSVACGQGQAFRQHLAVFEGAVEDPRAELPCGRVTVPSLFWLPGLPHTSMSVSTLPTPRPFHISSDFFQILCFHSWFGWPICTPGAWRMTPDLANDKIGDWCVVGQLCLPRSLRRRDTIGCDYCHPSPHFSRTFPEEKGISEVAFAPPFGHIRQRLLLLFSH